MATDPVAREMIRALDKRVTALETRATGFDAKIATLQGHDNRTDQTIVDLKNADAALDGRVTALEEAEPEPPEPQPPTPPPVAACTVSQLATPPYTMRMEATDQGPDTAYAWKLGKDSTGDGEDTATGRVLEAVTYPHAGQYTVELKVTNPGGQDVHRHDLVVAEQSTEPEPPDPPDPLPPVFGEHVTADPAWKPNLVDVNFDKYADTVAMMAASKPSDPDSMFGAQPPWIRTYDGDVSPPTCSLALVVNEQCGVKACRSNYVPPGSCGSVDRVTRAVGWTPAQPRIFAERVQMLSPNFNAHDPACGANPGDFKNEGIDTVGDMSGNFRVMACNSANNENPLGTPAFNTPDPSHNDVYANGARIVVPVGQRFSFLWDVKCSSSPSVANGHIWIGYKNHDTGEFKTLHEKTGLRMSDGTVADKLLDKFFWCHNLDRAKPGALWNDTFSVKIGSNRPAWAKLP